MKAKKEARDSRDLGIRDRNGAPFAGRTALAYVRVSVVGDRAKRGRFDSPDLQREAIDQWCATRGIKVVDEIRDLNRSGGHLTRPGLEQAMKAVPTLADGIVVARGDRASRRALDGLGLLDQLERAGGWIAAADGSIDTTTRTAPMATTMFFAMGQSELERFQETSAIVHRRAIVEKARHMGGTPFGYRRDGDKRLVVFEEEAEWVRWVFRQRADGRGWTVIARELADRDVRQRNGRRLTPHMLRRMVTHRVYLGEAHHGKHSLPDAHPRIVDAVLFEAANRVEPGAPPVRSGQVNPLVGLPRCAGCSYVMKPQRQRNGDYRWLCRTLLSERSATHECPAPARVRASEHAELERLVVDAAERIGADVGAESADDEAYERAQRERIEAEQLLDELATLERVKALGLERVERLAIEAREAVEAAKSVEARERARRRKRPVQARRLGDDLRSMDPVTLARSYAASFGV